jgi:hypothetical protein
MAFQEERGRSRSAVRLLRRLRLALVALLVVWFFSPPSIRDAVPLWLPFAAALLLEVQFVAANYRSTAPFFTRDDRRPSGDDVRRYGDGMPADWAIVDVEGESVWVDLAEDEDDDDDDAPVAATARPLPQRSRLRRLLRPALEAAAVLAVVAGLVVLLDRGSWDDLGAAERRSTEARISAEAGAVAGKQVRVGCDTSGRRVGAVQHADGVAIVGGDQAYLTPELCYALHKLAADGEVPAFSTTARAIAVLAHEAWHLRGERDEGVTECYALQSGVAVGRRLGLDEDTARRMMRSQLVANQLHRQGSAEYVVPAGCVNRGPLDLSPEVDRFP